jgi:ribosomal protein L7/L12
MDSESVENLAVIAHESESIEAALGRLHAVGASPIAAIKALRNGKHISLREAKEALHASPSWHLEARAAESLHDEILSTLNDEADL